MPRSIFDAIFFVLVVFGFVVVASNNQLFSDLGLAPAVLTGLALSATVFCIRALVLKALRALGMVRER